MDTSWGLSDKIPGKYILFLPGVKLGGSRAIWPLVQVIFHMMIILGDDEGDNNDDGDGDGDDISFLSPLV